MKNIKKPSHIIIYVDKEQKDNSVCAFCTKSALENKEIEIKVQCYDNQLSVIGQLDDFIGTVIKDANDDISKDSLFVVTDNGKTCEYLSLEGLAFAALITSYNRGQSFRKALYCIEDIEYVKCDMLIKMWQRFRGIAWTIAITDRTIIREQTLDDIDDLYRMYDDPFVVRYMENLYSDRDEELSYMKDYIANQYKYCEYGIWAIEELMTGSYIGRAGISLRAGFDELELGYVISKDYRNQGYASEVCTEIIKYMKETYDIESLIAFTRRENGESRALLEKLGFEFCRIEYINNEPHDMYRRVLT